MIIINRTTASFLITIYAPGSSECANQNIDPNQMLVLKLTYPPPPSGDIGIYQVNRWGPPDSRGIFETFYVPGDATIIFSTEIQTNLFGAD